MSRLVLFLVLVVTLIANSNAVSHLDRVMSDLAKSAEEYNKQPNFENFVKNFVPDTDSDTLAYLKRKFADGEMRGTLPKIQIKNHEVTIEENTFEVIDLERRKFTLNGYELQFKVQMTAKDRFEYIERILRSQKSSAWWELLPKANAGTWGNMIGSLMDKVTLDSYSKKFGEGLKSFNGKVIREQGTPYAVSKFSCNENDLNVNVDSKDFFMSLTMMPLEISDADRAKILSKNLNYSSSEYISSGGRALFDTLYGTEARTKKQKSANEAELAAKKASSHSITQSMGAGDVFFTMEGNINVASNDVQWEDQQYCIPFNGKFFCAGEEWFTYASTDFASQSNALSKFNPTLYKKLTKDCRIPPGIWIDSDLKACPDLVAGVKKYIEPHWKNLMKLKDKKELLDSSENKQLASAAYSCFREDKKKEDCCKAIPESFQGSRIEGYKGSSRKAN